MLKKIHLAAAFADVSAVELGKAAVERSGMKPEDVNFPTFWKASWHVRLARTERPVAFVPQKSAR